MIYIVLILIIVNIVVSCYIVYTVQDMKKELKKVCVKKQDDNLIQPNTKRRISEDRYNTILKNVDCYNGTSEGQERVI